MKILVVGGGGREHTLLNQYKKSPRVKKLYSVPGNGLMDFKSKKPVKIYPDIKSTDKKSIWGIINRERIDLVDVAQDDPLAEGMVDFLIATHHNPPSIYCEIVVRVKKKKASRQETFVAYVSTASQTFQNASARAFSIAALKARAATIA